MKTSHVKKAAFLIPCIGTYLGKFRRKHQDLLSTGAGVGALLLFAQDAAAASGPVAEGFDADSWWSKSIIVFGMMIIMFGMTVAYYFYCRKVKKL